MAHQPQDETTQPTTPPSTETNTTLTITPLTYLSTRLIVPYFITTNGTIKRPEHLIAWWSRIFSFYVPGDKDRIELRSLCRLYRDALKPPPLWTTFPHSNPRYSTLDRLMNRLNTLYKEDPTKIPTLILIAKGVYETEGYYTRNDQDGIDSDDSEYDDCDDDDEDNENEKWHEPFVVIKYPVTIIGAGRDETFIVNGGFEIRGNKKEKERGKQGNKKENKVVLQDMTISESKGAGLYSGNGLSFLCNSMTFTKCRKGVFASNTKGRLINCVITQCATSGIFSSGENGLIEVEGNQTKVEGNVTSGDSRHYGLAAYSSGSIHVLLPLTKESISIDNNKSENNYGGYGTII